MTLVQLEYIIAVDTYKNFVMAAEKCFVTQPALSMQVKKLEEELGIIIFDRSKQPIIVTDVGKTLLQQARQVLGQAQRIREIANESKGVMEGTLHVGMIPTLAPYLIPRFLTSFMDKFPDIKLQVIEMSTGRMIQRLNDETIDCGILATPLDQSTLMEQVLFYEQFIAFVSRKSSLYKHKTISAKDMDQREMWILDEGHCLRNQVLNLCKKSNTDLQNRFQYESGSLETLMRLVEMGNGSTILPELAVDKLTSRQIGMLRYFKDPAPVREISIVTRRSFLKRDLINALRDEIKLNVPEHMTKKEAREVIAI